MLSCLAGCSGPDDPTIAAYQVYLSASSSDTTAQRIRTHDCTASGHFTVPLPVEPTGTVELRLLIRRTLTEYSGTHAELTSADTVVDAALLAYDGLGEGSMSFSLTAGSYSLAPAAGDRSASYPEYAGDWTCGPDLPLAHDSTLAAYGYDPNLDIPGTWHISENLPIE
jgi:hypothetical protein